MQSVQRYRCALHARRIDGLTIPCDIQRSRLMSPSVAVVYRERRFTLSTDTSLDDAKRSQSPIYSAESPVTESAFCRQKQVNATKLTCGDNWRCRAACSTARYGNGVKSSSPELALSSSKGLPWGRMDETRSLLRKSCSRRPSSNDSTPSELLHAPLVRS